MSRLALKSIQPPIQGVEASFSQVKWLEREANHATFACVFKVQ
jgi:hypothetical protein